MRLSFIVTIDPVKGFEFMNLLVHSLNLQTRPDFDVFFYNQTLSSEEQIWSQLEVEPNFPFEMRQVERDRFHGRYPIWDLYAFHHTLLQEGRLGDYVMALHTEEFLDPDYVEKFLGVLERKPLEILFGNLSRTQFSYRKARHLLEARDATSFKSRLAADGFPESNHWSFDYRPLFWRKNPHVLKAYALRWWLFRFRKRLHASPSGYSVLGRYLSEDVFAMSTRFARETNWFLQGHSLCFEDIHICQIKGVCELGPELSRRIEFPAYFNLARIYHLEHRRYYYQFENAEFTAGLLKQKPDSPEISALQHAIRAYQSGRMTLPKALAYSRRNPEGNGTQNLNWRYHMKYLNPDS